ncbi:hypothetical protein C8A01DRAFT_18826 [Parachaetomium inaequale]|uniref:Uncharacterized protein n=1 Tax=Parachaetomium inaequale TaxID=2588326 RepID=A0AAN6P9U0_9PEZI|nr:hypothetical protein C8A01DRAFT_18826 [Parachaetomium inaequale]
MDQKTAFNSDSKELPVAPRPVFPAPSAAGSSAPLFRTPLACITLNHGDRIRFINLPEPDVAALRGVVQSTWPKGIQKIAPYGQAQELKLGGWPWRRTLAGFDDSRRLLIRLLETLHDRGWVLHGAIDLSKKEHDTDTLVFRHQSPPPPSSDWLVVSVDDYDKLRIVSSPPPDLAAAVIGCFGPAVKRHQMDNSHLEIKFHGYPFCPSGTDEVNAGVMLLALLGTLEAFGFTLYANFVHTWGERPTDVLVLHRQKGWAPGMPIWHK